MFRSLGFVPVISGLVSQMDGNTNAAYIYGYIWIEKNSDNQFNEPLKNIPDRLGVSPSTVNRCIKWLCENDFMIDLTPDLNGKPHTYLLTDRVTVQTGITVAIWASRSPKSMVNLTKDHGQFDHADHGQIDTPGYVNLTPHDHDKDMMHDGDLMNQIKQSWQDIQFDTRALPKMLKTWQGNEKALLLLLDLWIEALYGGWLPVEWGAGLIYTKIKDGEAPPDKPRTIGDDVKDMMDYQNGLSDESEETDDENE